MSKGGPKPFDYYPYDFFSHSKTFKSWVPLTAASVHALTQHSNYAEQRIYFVLNHPIKWVSVVGPVVAIVDINTTWSIITLDDGSGATLDLRIHRLAPEVYKQSDCPSNTTVSNLDVIAALGVFDIAIDGSKIDIGTVLRVRGTVSKFRGHRQLDIERVSVVKTTQEEAQFWAKIAQLHQEVLSEPWQLTESQVSNVQKELRERKRQEEEKKQRKQDREARRRKILTRNKAALEKEEKKQEKRRQFEEANLRGTPLI